MQSLGTNASGGIHKFALLLEEIVNYLKGNVAPSEDEEPQDPQAANKERICANCKTPIQEGEIFCSGCGTKVIKTQNEERKPTSLTCKKCGKNLQEDWLVCPYCNTKTGPKICAQCAKTLQDEWKVCPFCSTPVPE